MKKVLVSFICLLTSLPAFARQETRKEKAARLVVEEQAYDLTYKICSGTPGFKGVKNQVSTVLKIASEGALSTAWSGDLIDLVTVTPFTRYLLKSEGFQRAVDQCYGSSQFDKAALKTSMIMADIAGHSLGAAALVGFFKSSKLFTSEKWYARYAKNVASNILKVRFTGASIQAINNRFFEQQYLSHEAYFQKLWGVYLNDPQFLKRVDYVFNEAVLILNTACKNQKFTCSFDRKNFFISKTKVSGGSFNYDISAELLAGADPVGGVVKFVSEKVNRWLDIAHLDLDPTEELSISRSILPSYYRQMPSGDGDLAMGGWDDFRGIDEESLYFFQYRTQIVPGQIVRKRQVVTPCGASGVESFFQKELPTCQKIPLDELMGVDYRNGFGALSSQKQSTAKVKGMVGSFGSKIVLYMFAGKSLAKILPQSQFRILNYIGTVLVSVGVVEFLFPDSNLQVVFEGELDQQAEFLDSLNIFLATNAQKANEYRLNPEQFQKDLEVFLRESGHISVAFKTRLKP